MQDLPPALTYYGSIAGVRQILTSGRLPLFEAHELGDPFLPNRFTELGFDGEAIYEEAVRYMTKAILGDKPPQANPNHPMQKAIRRWRMENRFHRQEEIRKALKGLLPALVEKALEDARARHQQWLNFISQRRMIPFFEQGKDPLLWLSEGDRHAGVALRFNCREPSFLDQALPCRYSRFPAHTVDLREVVELMVGHTQDIELDFEEILLTCNYNLRWQNEWRFVVEQKPEDEPWFEFEPRHIQSLFIGALVPETMVNEILIEAELLNSDIRVFQMQCVKNSYQLEPRLISGVDDDITHQEIHQ